MAENLGLTSQQVRQKLSKYGENVLPEKPPPSSFSIFLSQLKSPLVYILLGSALITFGLKDYTDTYVISVALVINTFLGFIQERRATNALEALKKLINPTAEVLRDGTRKIIPFSDIVPGDVCIVNAGDKIPADGKVITSKLFFVSEAILTGESVPVTKDSADKVFMGTIVTSGMARVLVESTGVSTELGKIAISVQDSYEDTPLRRQLNHFSRQLTYLVSFLTAFVVVVGIILDMDVVEIFKTSVALAVSAIPEGLLVGLTVVLSVGMQRILKKKGLVRNLVSAETLGGVTTICVDKTGTLTEGKMRVTDVVGSEMDIAKQALVANDLDDPITIAMWEWAKEKLKKTDLKVTSADNYIQKYRRVDSIPFSSQNRFFACLTQINSKEKTLFVSGAPEFLVGWSIMSSADKKKISENIEALTGSGKRVIGLAKKPVLNSKENIDESDVKNNLDWVGLIAFSDPLRTGVKEALEKTKEAQVKLIVITGDYAQTAEAIIEQLGIKMDKKDITLGSELQKMKTKDLEKFLAETAKVKLFARTTPDQKLKIVNALKNNGEVVAMMGDGVNDAPALKKADIGIVVADASDVAKESADLILLDSSFSTIVAAIEEGRGIFNNIRKIILYLMSDAFEEIIAVVGVLILGIFTSSQIPLPITAVQILWINLVSDGFPHLALTVDPNIKGLMSQKPKNPKEPLVTDKIKKLIAVTSVWGGLSALIIFYYFYRITGNIDLARSVAFAALGLNSLFYVFSVRNLENPIWRDNPFRNRWLNIAVLGGLFLQIVPFTNDLGRNFLGLEKLKFEEWVVVFLSSLFMLIMIELFKRIGRFPKTQNYYGFKIA
jgi:Ca2+-transporting ATPase